MSKTRPPYPPEFRARMVELVRSGPSISEQAREFEPSANSIHNWVKQADMDEGRREDGLTTEERKELSGLRRENKRLRMERQIVANATACSLGRPTPCPEVFRFVSANQATVPVATMCRVLGVSTSSLYAWLQRPPSKRTHENACLSKRIHDIHRESWTHLRGASDPR